MFFLRAAPLPLDVERLLQVRFSLNTPVINTGELPGGPARAAIVVFTDARGHRGLALAIRSLQRSEVSFFSFEEDLESEADLCTAVDAALSFGESMGFLFDDDALASGGADARRGAWGRWCELVSTRPDIDQPGEPVPAAALGAPQIASPDAPCAGEAPEEEAVRPDELLLDDPLEDEEAQLPAATAGEAAARPAPRPPYEIDEPPGWDPDALDEPDAPLPRAASEPHREIEPDAPLAQSSDAPAPPLASVPPVSGSVPLSKFRSGALVGAARPTPSAIARIPLRKRRRDEPTGGRPRLLLRILGGF